MRKILKNLLLIFLIIILLLVCYSKYIRKDSITKLFGKGFLIIVTGSMYPNIEAKELVIISEKPEYKVGDIITYLDEDEMLVTHRITELNNNTFISKGDKNNIEDGEHEKSSIQGKVIFHSKILGNFVLYILKPLIIIYLGLLVLLELRNVLKKEKLDAIEN